jgi:hypothetical protein
MRPWKEAFTRGLVTGSVASVASTAAIALFSRIEAGHAAAGSNATSQWLFGQRAVAQNATSLKHTLTGYAIHHLMSIFWATLYERHLRSDADASEADAWVKAALTAALAAAVDFRLMPARFTPGFEKRLSRGALLAIYACYAAGLGSASSRLPHLRSPCVPR